MSETYITVREIAGRLRCSKMTIYREIHAGKLDMIRVGRSFRIPESSYHRYTAIETEEHARDY